MNGKKFFQLAAFNLSFVVLEVILFSRGILNLGTDFALAFAVAAMSVAAFLGVNYAILNESQKKKHHKVDRLKDIQDYREAIVAWSGKNNPFNSEIREAVHQLDLFNQKQAALKALLGDQAREPANPFMNVSEDVRDCLLSNMRKFLNRMMILDPIDQSKFPVHNAFIHHILGQNRQLLSQYDNLIIEISQIGDSSNLEDLNLDGITEALRELRDEHPTMGEYGAAMMMQQGMWDE